MSYARFSSTSDIYVFENDDGYIQCCACALAGPSGSWFGASAAEARNHLAAHRAVGHLVPAGLEDIIVDPGTESDEP